MKAISWIILGFAAGTAWGAEPPPLTLQQAHETALRNHPLISVADLKALASHEVFKQARSAYFPIVSGNVLGVGAAADNTRLEAVGSLTSSSIYDRGAGGLMVSQLITDFGRTANLTGSAKLRAQAEAENARATREQILLGVDGAFYGAQQAQAVTKVARQTVATRQTFLDQVTALATNKLRSELDVSFAQVNLEQGQLLLSQAQNDLEAAFAQLSNMLGLNHTTNYALVEEPLPPQVSTNAYDFVQLALRLRPELLSLRNQREAASKFALAQRDARWPTISAVGAAGGSPIHDSVLPDTYAAAGVMLNIPLFAGGLYVARQHEAELQAEAAQESLRDLEDNVIRDVRIAWLNTQNAFETYRIMGQLVETSRQAYELAQARYKNGISSIVEFDQAELGLVSAQINYANSQYEYLLRRSALSYQAGVLH